LAVSFSPRRVLPQFGRVNLGRLPHPRQNSRTCPTHTKSCMYYVHPYLLKRRTPEQPAQAAGVTLIIQPRPNRSVTIPKRGDQNVLASDMVILPTSARAATGEARNLTGRQFSFPLRFIQIRTSTRHTFRSPPRNLHSSPCSPPCGLARAPGGGAGFSLAVRG
jgi:hypothetical protein